MKIITKDADGEENGWMLPIWNCRESDYRPDQVYVTAVNPHCSKGPHLHKVRTGFFSCIQGNVTIITRKDGTYEKHWLGLHNAHKPLKVEPGTACQIVNRENDPAVLLNMPSPSWAADEPDEWPVENWNPDGS